MKLLKKVRQASLGFSALLGSAVAVYAASTPICTSGAGGGANCNVGGLKTQITSEMKAGAQIFYAGAAIIGIALVIIGLLKLKAHSMDTQGTSGHLRAAIWLLIIGALLIAVPVIMALGSSSIFGGSQVSLPSESGLFPTSPA